MIYGIRLNLLCIDEAHCASVYSHSFRPSYALLEGYLDILSKNSFEHKLRCCFEDNMITEKDRQEIAEMDIELENMKQGDDIFIEDDYKNTKSVADIVATKQAAQKKKTTSKVPILCLTATSSRETKQSVMKQFNISESNYLYSSCYIRKNLGVTVSMEHTRIKDIVKLLSLPSTRKQKPLLVYCNFNKTIGGLLVHLKQSGFNAQAFTGEVNEL